MPGAGDNPLLGALALLVEADPARGSLVLRKAIASLVSDDTRKMGRVSTKDPDAWAQTRDRLRRAMAADKLTAMQLGQLLELSESAIDKCSAPNGWVPSAAIAAKVEAWLLSRDKPNGSKSPPAPGGNGVERPSGRLTVEQAAKLSGYTSLMSDRRVREVLGLTPNLLTQALAGKPVPGEVVARLADALADPSRLIAGAGDGAC